jgi:large subunit ribosomal protein L29
MKAEEVRDLADDELAAKESEIKEQVFRLRFQIEMGQTDGVKKYRALKKDLARVLTVAGERERRKPKESNEGKN